MCPIGGGKRMNYDKTYNCEKSEMHISKVQLVVCDLGTLLTRHGGLQDKHVIQERAHIVQVKIRKCTVCPPGACLHDRVYGNATKDAPGSYLFPTHKIV